MLRSSALACAISMVAGCAVPPPAPPPVEPRAVTVQAPLPRPRPRAGPSWSEPVPFDTGRLPRVTLMPPLNRIDAEMAFGGGTPNRGFVPEPPCFGGNALIAFQIETLSLAGDAKPRLNITDAIQNTANCELRIARRVEAHPLPIAGRFALAFVSVPLIEQSATAGESLEVLLPRVRVISLQGRHADVTTQERFSRVSLPMWRGETSALWAAIPRHAIVEWLDMLALDSRAQELAVELPSDGEVSVFVEVGRGVRDERPIGIAFSRGPLADRLAALPD